MRYGWKPERMPDKCICSAQFSVEYALTSPHGGFTFIRTMKSGIWQQTCSQRCAMVSILNRTCSHSQMRHSLSKPQMVKTTQGWTFEPVASGGRDGRMPFLTLGCSTHMHPATVSPHQEHATASMRRRRGGNMKRESCWDILQVPCIIDQREE